MMTKAQGQVLTHLAGAPASLAASGVGPLSAIFAAMKAAPRPASQLMPELLGLATKLARVNGGKVIRMADMPSAKALITAAVPSGENGTMRNHM